MPKHLLAVFDGKKKRLRLGTALGPFGTILEIHLVYDVVNVVQAYLGIADEDAKANHQSMVTELNDSFFSCSCASTRLFMKDLKKYMRHCRCIDKYYHEHCLYWMQNENVDYINDGGVPTARQMKYEWPDRWYRLRQGKLVFVQPWRFENVYY